VKHVKTAALIAGSMMVLGTAAPTLAADNPGSGALSQLPPSATNPLGGPTAAKMPTDFTQSGRESGDKTGPMHLPSSHPNAGSMHAWTAQPHSGPNDSGSAPHSGPNDQGSAPESGPNDQGSAPHSGPNDPGSAPDSGPAGGQNGQNGAAQPQSQEAPTGTEKSGSGPLGPISQLTKGLPLLGSLPLG
jgi:N-acetylmuramoyl-L-alanine amidase